MLRNGIIKALTALVLLGTLALSGCGTLMARASNQYISYDLYKGTQQNIQLLTMRDARGYDGYDGYATIYCWMSIVCPLVAVVSLPVDAAVDTVLLPYDAKGVYY
ncbi:YceK/YidQ family lipoprotein [Pseudomonas sp. NFPP07]|uniref:YceK/YidQ family lipoprotein n=1 Tax=Pseudomonas sp. NFPP07 TaxID=1566213 RepID=UPI000B8964DA|nr:YceK/YidQ family lipoprotein [Pseudomonas sp. NFPP07]